MGRNNSPQLVPTEGADARGSRAWQAPPAWSEELGSTKKSGRRLSSAAQLGGPVPTGWSREELMLACLQREMGQKDGLFVSRCRRINPSHR